MNLLNSIELFVKTIESGSFSKLGRELHLAPSSISRQINSLEEELGVRLLQRSTRNISLTEAGQIYYQRVSKILTEIEDARQAISELQQKPSGTLRINVAVPFGEKKIVPLIPNFLQLYPDIKIDLTLEDRRINLIDERVDVAIRIGRLDDSSLIARKLANNRFVICGSTNYFKEKGMPKTPEELTDFNCIINKNLNNASQWFFRKNKTEHSVFVSGNLQANTGGALLKAILSDLGIAMLPTWLINEEINNGNLQIVLSDFEVNLPIMSDSAIYALYPASQFLPPKVRVFIDYLIENLTKE